MQADVGGLSSAYAVLLGTARGGAARRIRFVTWSSESYNHHTRIRMASSPSSIRRGTRRIDSPGSVCQALRRAAHLITHTGFWN